MIVVQRTLKAAIVVNGGLVTPSPNAVDVNVVRNRMTQSITVVTPTGEEPA